MYEEYNVGLSTSEAKELYKKGFGNVQIDNTAKTAKDIVRENIFTYFNLIFLIMAILLIISGAWNSLTFLPVIICNSLIGIFQELKAKKILDKLSVINQSTATAIRDGSEDIVFIEKLVLGDVVLLTGGCQICADAVVIDGEIAVNEALLTGEADEIVKTKGSELKSGSFVVSGRCLCELTKVGADSYISKLMLKAKRLSSSEQSEMVRSIDKIVKAAGIAIIPIGIALFVQGFYLQGNSFSETVPSVVAALIGMIPEGLYLLLSITLVLSTIRLAKNKVMLHDMRSIESLARVDTICVDKTGTITDNSMLVADAVLCDNFEKDNPDRFNDILVLISDYIGCVPDDNITMQALENYFKNSTNRTCLSFHAFSSKYKYSAVQFDDATYVLGAPEFVLGNEFENYSGVINSYAAKGLRVLCFGQYRGGADGEAIVSDDEISISLKVPETSLKDAKIVPLSFILLQNPVRENAPETFEYFRRQGVDIKVISGDSPVTVSEVARHAGINHADRFIDASTLDDGDIPDAVKKYTIFGRVSPEQKQKIVKSLKRAGHTVAMTGDGVNDILAMKDADCSIAMAAGSDAAIQAAQVVLLDSDFSKMPQIVSEGRRNINNIERTATLFLVKNIFSLLLALFSIISVVSYPLQPSQITMVSLVNIGIPGFFLAMEPNNRRIDGSFLIKVLLKAMPAALTDFFAIAALVVFGNTFGVTSEDISVASTFLLAIVGFIILINISYPLNKYRLRVIIGCIIGMIVGAVVFHDLFSINYVSIKCIMLFVLFAIATEPFMRYLTMLFTSIEKKFENGKTKNKVMI
ncbi:HAD-IC family P-type ATPase [Butyrivibrio sp. YAB3001]|uniref:HAD-IC family P-type ATPase n=1 Tax=Butyrivibrio sp. YAB3001 TaxID=1520812 RepID=UPI0008F624B7|nr:HAD-IC family P-type ATPase [Butyrivibrio sp. YAB3001]SFB67028.1 cation-transporting ATPase E [Butyrivibrio sp. YAB3001]